jgi:hypothetical protein
MNIFLEPGQIFRVVKYDEPLQAHFLVREKYERSMLSESGGWDTTFKEDGWKGSAWHTVEYEMPAWVGKKYLEYAVKYPYHEIIELIEI